MEAKAAPQDRLNLTDARNAVTALYEAHALGLIRLAVVMLGDRPAAEDVVEETFTPAGHEVRRRHLVKWGHGYNDGRAAASG